MQKGSLFKTKSPPPPPVTSQYCSLEHEIKASKGRVSEYTCSSAGFERTYTNDA